MPGRPGQAPRLARVRRTRPGWLRARRPAQHGDPLGQLGHPQRAAQHRHRRDPVHRQRREAEPGQIAVGLARTGPGRGQDAVQPGLVGQQHGRGQQRPADTATPVVGHHHQMGDVQDGRQVDGADLVAAGNQQADDLGAELVDGDQQRAGLLGQDLGEPLGQVLDRQVQGLVGEPAARRARPLGSAGSGPEYRYRRPAVRARWHAPSTAPRPNPPTGTASLGVGSRAGQHRVVTKR